MKKCAHYLAGAQKKRSLGDKRTPSRLRFTYLQGSNVDGQEHGSTYNGSKKKAFFAFLPFLLTNRTCVNPLT
jgi:hypothetical protein